MAAASPLIIVNPKIKALMEKMVEAKDRHLLKHIVANPSVSEDVPNNTFGPRGGPFVPRDEFKFIEPFIEYGPEDIPYLLYAGKIVEGRSMGGYIMELPKFEPHMPPSMLVDDGMLKLKFSLRSMVMESLMIPKGILFNG